MTERRIINRRDAAAHTVVGIQPRELHVEHGRLHLVHARVATTMAEHILPAAPVVAQQAHHLRQPFVVRRHRPGIAECPEVLRGIETVAGRIAQSPRLPSVPYAAVCLRIVLNQFQPVLPTEVGHAGRKGTTAIEMDHHHGTGATGNGLRNQAVVDLQRLRVGIHEHGDEAILRNS